MRTPAFFLFLFCCACSHQPGPAPLTIQQDQTTYLVEIQKRSDSAYLLSTRRQGDEQAFSRWPLRYPVYTLQTGDVDHDGTDDILVGVIKKTRYDQKVRKRLFIFKLVEGLIRPLWLGSRVAHPLEDFAFCPKKNLSTIMTIEKDAKNYLVAEYAWKGFGLGFLRYIQREIDLKKAREIVRAHNHTTQ